MQHNIITPEQLPEGERINLKKGMFQWRVVNPTNDENGKIIWINVLFGGWANLIMLIIFLLLLGLIMYSYNHDIMAMKDVVANPCNYCSCIGRY